MGKMKYYLFTVLCVLMISILAACGRNDGTANHTGSGNGGGVETSSGVETGGVLRDMVDDVEHGVERMEK